MDFLKPRWIEAPEQVITLVANYLQAGEMVNPIEAEDQISHGAILAREYGIPAVVNVIGATRHIRDGRVIIVDGTNGRVLLGEDTASPFEHCHCTTLK